MELPKKSTGTNTDGLNVVDGNYNTAYIALGHELVHAEDGMNGDWLSDEKYSQHYDSKGNLIYKGGSYTDIPLVKDFKWKFDN